jgi:hypothetical protein
VADSRVEPAPKVLQERIRYLLERMFSPASSIPNPRPAAPPKEDAPIIGRRDMAPESLGDLALEAGTRTAILSQCSIDSAPIKFVFEHQLETAGMGQTARSDLWQSYWAARSSAAAALARSGMTECEGAYGLLKETIHDLDRSASEAESGS